MLFKSISDLTMYPPLQLDLLLKEDGCKEKVAAAKAQANLLQGKLDFYVNDV